MVRNITSKFLFFRCTIDSEETWSECKSVYKNFLIPKILKIKLADRESNEVFQEAISNFTSNISEIFTNFTGYLFTPAVTTTTTTEIQNQNFLPTVQQQQQTMIVPSPIMVTNKPIYRPVENQKTEIIIKEEPQIIEEYSIEVEEKLQLLKSMGFSNEEENIILLKQHNFEIQPVVQDLLNFIK